MSSGKTPNLNMHEWAGVDSADYVELNENFNILDSEVGNPTKDPTPSEIMKRDALGRSQVEAPSAAKDVTNKKYVDDLDVENVKKTGSQTIQGEKTFESSPIVPTPQTNMQTSNKKYIDDAFTVHSESGDHDERYYTKVEISSTTDGQSGADKMGVTTIPTLAGNTVQAVLESTKERFDDISETNVNVEVANTHIGADGRTYATLPARLDSVDNEIATIEEDIEDLSKNTAGKGASIVGVQDAGGYFTGTNVETVTQEIGSQLADIAVNVKNFGAVGNGVTDDTTAIQNAINSLTTGGIVLIPKGTYIISSSIIVPSYITIQGTGMYGTTLKAKTASASAFSVFKVNTDGANSIVFKDILIDGDGSAQTQSINGIEFNPPTNPSIYCKIQDVVIKESKGNGLKLINVDQIKIINSTIRDSYGGNVYVSNCEYVDFNNCTIRSAKIGAYGLLLDGTTVQRVSVMNCLFSANGSHAIYTSQVKKIHIENCHIDNNTGHGFYLDRTNQSKIIGCTIELNNSGIVIDKGSYNQINQNEVFSNSNMAVGLYDTNYNQIDGNNIYDNNTGNNAGADGIFIGGSTGADDNTITANRIRKGTGYQKYGIRIDGAVSNNNKVSNNDVRGSGETGDYYDTGTGTVKTSETKSGTATITASATSVVVTHGLSGTPSKITATPQGNIGNVWISGMSSTEFTINCSVAPGANTLVSYQVEY